MLKQIIKESINSPLTTTVWGRNFPVLVKFLLKGGFEQGAAILLHFKAFPIENTSLALVKVSNPARRKVRPGRMVNNSFDSRHCC